MSPISVKFFFSPADEMQLVCWSRKNQNYVTISFLAVLPSTLERILNETWSAIWIVGQLTTNKSATTTTAVNGIWRDSIHCPPSIFRQPLLSSFVLGFFVFLIFLSILQTSFFFSHSLILIHLRNTISRFLSIALSFDW